MRCELHVILLAAQNYAPEAVVNPYLVGIGVNDIVESTRVMSVHVHEGDEAHGLLGKVVEHMGAAPGLKRYGLCKECPLP